MLVYESSAIAHGRPVALSEALEHCDLFLHFAPRSAVQKEASLMQQFLDTYTDDRPRLDKWVHYIPIYERYFEAFRRRGGVRMLEIGVASGGSLELWRSFFGPSLRLYALDNDTFASHLESDDTSVFLGDQADRSFLRATVDAILAEVEGNRGFLDIILDDGGHVGHQQTATFEELFFRLLAPGGIFVVEDVHCNYHPHWEGGYRRLGTFAEFAKGLLDIMHLEYAAPVDQTRLLDDWPLAREALRWVNAVQIHDSIIVVEKRTKPRPVVLPLRAGSALP